jgi:hypothetical protein
MARKRGGLAGVWDRNKQIIKPVATLAAGALTGGAGGAVVGGLMNGLDREGKGGIGFDAKRGAVGAATGYGMGKVGGALKSGVMSRMGANAGNQLVANNPLGAAAIRGASGNTGAMSMPDGAANVGRKFMSGVGGALKNGATVKALGDTALGAYGAVQDNRTAKIEREREERRRMMEDQDRARNQAMDPMRAQLLAMIMSRLGGQSGGMPA